ncbi:hypothetical protein MLD38_018689 [Melastoma candidum]|uniref:Uncharacterized protein n=1 Tax=Melastoma candidum TaxID=119954 RepID=A0ACB9QXQ9_9MYRT|nr:hypothetical protein MLD38_018689 [Melastoma candidum]
MARVRFHALFLACFVLLAAVQRSTQDIVAHTCKECANPVLPFNFCVKTLSSDPRSRTADLVGLGVIAIEHLKDSVKRANLYAAGLLKKKVWDPYTASCLKDCVELYTDAVDDIPDIEAEYKGKSYADAQTHLSAIEDSSITCETQFKEKKPITSQNLEATQSASLALAIINLIPK